MTTDLAFRIMISTRGIYKTLCVAPGTVAKWRHDIKNGTYKISLDKKVQLLLKAGFKMRQEMRWTIVNVGDNDSEIKDVDYLTDFPGLTLVGRRAGMKDETIRRANKMIVEDPAKFRKIYKLMA